MSKTIEQWFNELDEHKELALENLEYHKRNRIESKMSDALAWGFRWSTSKHNGNEWMWADLWKKYLDKGE
tara:strand:+ start:159 stop:368 length:210 start_codon:yes stop_codon:yes gene_type:complete